MKQYYVTDKEGQQQGPLDEQLVREQYAAGAYDDGTLAWAEGMPDWAPIASLFPQEEPKAVISLPVKPTAAAPAPLEIQEVTPVSEPDVCSDAEAEQPHPQPKTFKDALLACFAWKNVTRYQGRASRKEYWTCWMYCMIASIVGLMLTTTGILAIVGLPLAIYAALIFVPTNCRRLHDAGMSGWWQLLNLIPYLDIIAFITWGCLKGQSGSNQYGPEPQE